MNGLFLNMVSEFDSSFSNSANILINKLKALLHQNYYSG